MVHASKFMLSKVMDSTPYQLVQFHLCKFSLRVASLNKFNINSTKAELHI